MAQISAQPGIKFVGAIDALPLVGGGGGPTRSIVVEGQLPDLSGRQHWARVDIVTPDYFKASGIPLLLGRPFSAQDSTDGHPVALISQAMAQRYWLNEYPVGKRVKIQEVPNDAWISVIGIVGDIRDDYVDAPPAPRIYLLYAQRPTHDMSLVIRAEDDPLSVVPAVRNAVRMIDRNLPVYEVHSMRQYLFNDLSTTYLFVELLGTFALAALLLSAVGIYGVVAYAVSQRAREIGIRMALGAQAGDVLRMVVSQGMSLTLIGVTLGLAAALALTRVIKSLLFNVSATDPATFALIALLLVSVALIASYIPARRAAKVDPLLAIHDE
jgi:putative ABC transport system permease protein